MATQLPPVVKVSELFQVGIVVRDLEESMKRYKNILGIESWQVVEINSSIVHLTYRGKPSQHSFKAAFTMLGSLMVELLQPLEGTGTYREFLDAHGEGLHHLGHARVDDLEEAVRALEKAGFPCVETGATPGDPAAGYHKWAYVDTTAALGYILEFSSGLDPRDVFGVR
jgi:methylmalonyl-CoA/ethylmalonyl-CoA epimerase